MTTQTITADCTPAARVTKSLLGYGALAGPFFVIVALAQAATRDGFDIRKHAWSLLSNGSLGWIQITNFLLTGLMVVAFAIGLNRALTTGRGSTWAPRLIGAYGVSLLGAGVFRADPGAGFPAGTPETTTISWHGMLHFMVGGVGFLCLTAACLILGSRFGRAGEKGWAVFSRVTGVVFLAAFVGIASGSGTPAIILSFVAAVILVWTWMACTAVKIYRTVR